MSSTHPKKDLSLDTQAEIDTCGLRCPLPLLQAKVALKALDTGDVLKVLATDPAAKADFEAMLRHLPHSLLSYQRLEHSDARFPWVDVFLIEKGAS